MNPFEQALLTVAALLLAAILASKLSDRLGVPSLLVFLALGMLAGSDGIGGIWFDDASLAQHLGTVALAVILFAGGFETHWRSASPVLWKSTSLATIGVLVTTAVTGLIVCALLGFSLREGLLIGAIVSSTDAAAVFSVLRARRLRLKGQLQPLLELESGSNDPMAVFLTIALTQLVLQPDKNPVDLLPVFVQQMGYGIVGGYAFGKIGRVLVNRIHLVSEGLYPVLLLSVALAAFAATALVGGSGFLAVYFCGIVLGSGQLLHKRSLSRFMDALAWLMQIAMFLTLGLLVFPSRLPGVAVSGTLIALLLVFLSRPLSVFLSLALARMNVREKLLISWVGLRGAVPIVLATFPLVARLPRASLYFDLVFFVVLVSVLLQGTTIEKVADWLKLKDTSPAPAPTPIEFVTEHSSNSELSEVLLPESSPWSGKRIVELRLPPSALVVLITRNGAYMVPRGDTVVRGSDTLLLLGDKKDIDAVRRSAEAASTV